MDNAPTALFDSYELEFQQFIESIRDKLESSSNDDPEQGEQRQASLRRTEMELEEADEMVSQMEIEIQGIPQSLRPQYQTRLRTAKADLTLYKKRAKELSHKLNRADLFTPKDPYGTSASDDPYSDSDRARLLAGTQLLEDGTRRLQESQRIAVETETQGADILLNLRSQREQIENSRGTLESTESNIHRAAGTLKQMIRRMYQQRIVTAAIIVVLILLIVVIIYEKLS
ncbi:vesicle transport v-snare protein vti1 [Fistulina hepatica ATCC 64428]|uniref:Vesicle transport v-snare protein vti1 n=1 Tax=Fistulina hepatica ATCC 64428 TaxID=1128425 RepID=A0A0D7A9K4_9AGAR|nr:vesicle transport v-snare protein vti1 [Fistulina hepatica ATCC 64428]